MSRNTFNNLSEYTENIKILFSNKLKKLLEIKNITQQELAEEMGVKRQTVNNYCNGKLIPSAPLLLLLAEYFGVSIEYFFIEEDDYFKKVSKELNDLPPEFIANYFYQKSKNKVSPETDNLLTLLFTALADDRENFTKLVDYYLYTARDDEQNVLNILPQDFRYTNGKPVFYDSFVSEGIASKITSYIKDWRTHVQCAK